MSTNTTNTTVNTKVQKIEEIKKTVANKAIVICTATMATDYVVQDKNILDMFESVVTRALERIAKMEKLADLVAIEAELYRLSQKDIWLDLGLNHTGDTEKGGRGPNKAVIEKCSKSIAVKTSSIAEVNLAIKRAKLKKQPVDFYINQIATLEKEIDGLRKIIANEQAKTVQEMSEEQKTSYNNAQRKRWNYLNAIRKNLDNSEFYLNEENWLLDYLADGSEFSDDEIALLADTCIYNTLILFLFGIAPKQEKEKDLLEENENTTQSTDVKLVKAIDPIKEALQ